jgi:hypothetical protein
MGLPESKASAASGGIDADRRRDLPWGRQQIRQGPRKHWLTVETAGKRTEKVRMTEVTRISRGGDAKPASNKE